MVLNGLHINIFCMVYLAKVRLATEAVKTTGRSLIGKTAEYFTDRSSDSAGDPDRTAKKHVSD
jgi:hypothetical protein